MLTLARHLPPIAPEIEGVWAWSPAVTKTTADMGWWRLRLPASLAEVGWIITRYLVTTGELGVAVQRLDGTAGSTVLRVWTEGSQGDIARVLSLLRALEFDGILLYERLDSPGTVAFVSSAGAAMLAPHQWQVKDLARALAVRSTGDAIE